MLHSTNYEKAQKHANEAASSLDRANSPEISKERKADQVGRARLNIELSKVYKELAKIELETDKNNML